MGSYETIGEVGHALEGVKGQISLYGKIITGMFALAVTVASAAFIQINGLKSEQAEMRVLMARFDERGIRMEAALATLVSDAQQIKKNTSLASIAIPEPTADSFNGWIGVQAEKELDTVPALADDKYKDAWIFLPTK